MKETILTYDHLVNSHGGRVEQRTRLCCLRCGPYARIDFDANCLLFELELICTLDSDFLVY